MPQALKILKASAGSGKTFSLAAHYLRLLFSGHRKYREILAVTFTNKATAEMKERILAVLEGFARGDRAFKPYQDIILNAYPELSPALLQEKADQIYRQLLHDYSRFSVSTIDGFVQRVIRSFTFELNLSAGYSLEMNYDKVKEELAKRLEQKLDQEEGLLQWMIELALDRIGNQKSWNYKKELLELSSEVFKNRFQEFEQAVNHFGASADELFKTYIALSKTQIKTYEEELARLCHKADALYQASFADNALLNGTNTKCLSALALIAAGDSNAFSRLASIFKLIDQPERWFKKGKSSPLYDSLNPALRAIEAYYNEETKHYLLAQAFSRNAYFLRLMQEMADILAEYRADSENLLISDAQKLLNGITRDAGDNPSFVWEKMGEIYRHFLFDEFQDTSAEQWNSFKVLLQNAISMHEGQQSDHLVVGDIKQAIYRWRDGDYQLLHQQVKTDVGEANVLEETLQDNRRSTAEIIDFNNRLYAALPALLQDQLQHLMPDVASGEAGAIPPLTAIYAHSAQFKHEKTPAGGKIIIQQIGVADTEDDSSDEQTAKRSKNDALLRAMVQQVARLIDEQGYRQQEIGVLVRSNIEAATVVQALMAAGRDVVSGDALNIGQDTAVQLIIQVLYLLSSPKKQSALYKANVLALYARLQGRVPQAADFLGLADKAIAALHPLLPAVFCRDYTLWLQLPLIEIIEQIIAAFITSDIHQHLPYLFAFKDICAVAISRGEKGISSFLIWWEEEGRFKNLPAAQSAQAIQVMTIHKSKGLAFRAVLVPFCQWELKGRQGGNFWVPAAGTAYQALGSMPLHYSSKLEQSAVASHYQAEVYANYMDALNAMYVATTRAIDFLYLGVPVKKRPSLTHIGDAVLMALSAFPAQGKAMRLAGGQDGAMQEVAAVHAEQLPPDVEQSSPEADDYTPSTIEYGSFVCKERRVDAPDPATSGNDRSIRGSNPATSGSNPAISERSSPQRHYPLSQRLSQIYEDVEERAVPYLENLGSSAKKGEILHRVLSVADTETRIDTELRALVLEGLLRQEELPAYKAQVLKVFHNTALKALLAGADTQFNERAIISATGKTRRPDKVLIKGKAVVLIDYKFTASREAKHKEQLHQYQLLLQEMGYAPVQAYLYYAEDDVLENISNI